jgi:hypothetical protein
MNNPHSKNKKHDYDKTEIKKKVFLQDKRNPPE